MHVTVGALLVRDGTEILLIEHLAYGITLQPGGPSQVSVVSPTPVYVEYGRVPARPAKDEPEHYHLDVGYAFQTAGAEV
ncbi:MULTISPECIES: hypothetical protein [Streptomyces]|uniref:hypothetical protein n=1 Tax=Streptomyces TaxID=1883 RepID=UPI00190A8E72|nr:MULTISPECIES: hypothetical protein [Streptomyces]MBK3521171.1 hypothetical protein [Streptomyces sp. MBT70]